MVDGGGSFSSSSSTAAAFAVAATSTAFSNAAFRVDVASPPSSAFYFIKVQCSGCKRDT